MNRFRRILSPPTFEGDAEKTRRAEVLYVSSFLLFIFPLLPIYSNLLAGTEAEKSINWILGFIAALQIVIQWMIRKGYINEASFILLTIGWAGLIEISRNVDGIRDVVFLANVLVLLGSGYLLGWQIATIYTLASIAAIWWLAYMETRGIIVPSLENTYGYALDQTFIYILIFLIIYFLSKTLTNALASAQRELIERKQVEAERERLITELQSKNEELERFTYTVSHDLKAPLITISGFLSYLEEDALKGDIDQLKNDIKRITDASSKMQHLLDELLNLSRIGRKMNPPETVSFEEIVREALENVRGRLDEGRIEVEVGSDLPFVHGDRIRLVEVVQNLLDNAAKFVGNQPKPLIEIGARKQEGKDIFSVKDNGIGIDPQYHDKIFELFDKLDPSSEGTGIGLALVKRIVNVHEGKIWVESRGKGTGTTFYFTLPQKPNMEKPEANNDG